MSHEVLVAYSLFAGLAFCTQVCAAEGKYDNQSCYAGPAHVIQHADGIVSGSFDLTGMTRGIEGSPFDRMSAHCVGSFANISGEQDVNGSCEYWNAAGDKYFGIFSQGRPSES